MAEIGHLREFSPISSDWSIFKARLLNYFAANGIKEEKDEDRMKAILLNTCDEEAYKLIFDLVSPEKSEQRTFGQLIKVFDEYFKPQQSAFALRYKFYAARKEYGETATQWAGRLRRLVIPYAIK